MALLARGGSAAPKSELTRLGLQLRTRARKGVSMHVRHERVTSSLQASASLSANGGDTCTYLMASLLYLSKRKRLARCLASKSSVNNSCVLVVRVKTK